jgi:hypothetical protein
LESGFEFGLLNVHLITNDISFLNETIPFLLDEVLAIKFFLRKDFTSQNRVDKKSIHGVDRSDIMAKIGLLLANFFKSGHNATERVNFSGGFVNLELDLLDIVIEVLKHGVGLLVEILGVTSLPLTNPVLKSVLDV